MRRFRACSPLPASTITWFARARVTSAGLLIETGEAREVHHIALLLGYGAGSVNPYLAFESLDDLIRQGLLPNLSHNDAVKRYIKALNKGVLKVMSKMGISTLQSYCGAQIFEAIGLDRAFVDRYFTSTASKIGGIGLKEISEEVRGRHARAYGSTPSNDLQSGGEYQWRRDGELHLFNPDTVFKLQHATRSGQYKIFKEYTALVDDQSKARATLRGLFGLKPFGPPVPLDEVEPLEKILRRFSTGAMSYGSISQEAHETLAIAMNRMGAKSNTGEGGEDPARYVPDANGDSRRSAIKQVASGRFGVTSEYLVNASDLQIKMAQGAKPGEGGQLPGHKVYPWIAKVRLSTPGVGLISPPPHHDIYSIEDLAQLIFDLKNANPGCARARQARRRIRRRHGGRRRIQGTRRCRAHLGSRRRHRRVAAHEPEARRRAVGARPRRNAAGPAHEQAARSHRRPGRRPDEDRPRRGGRGAARRRGVRLRYGAARGDGLRDDARLPSQHLPVGIATQDPELRKTFNGKPEFVQNFFKFIAEEVRELMADLGFRTFDQMIGRVESLDFEPAKDHWKAHGLDLSPVLVVPDPTDDVARRNTYKQDAGLAHVLDHQLIEEAMPALDARAPVEMAFAIRNTDRTTGTMLGYEVTKRFGGEGLPDDTIRVNLTGSAGQSFGAFIPKGITLALEGEANDFVGKGLSGGKLIVRPPAGAAFVPEENVIIGNVALYGATSGDAFVSGVAGERFAVRNSGAHAVVEGVGDHGCEYMTGGRIVVLGRTGRNFAAGMSGGIAYVLDTDGSFALNCNIDMVDLERLHQPDEVALVRDLIARHVELTGSGIGRRVLDNWAAARQQFVAVMPRDFKRVKAAEAKARSESREAAFSELVA
jgi:glutamate synthase domain-containing protein 2/glutamate synthase domain-containing protein 3